jgi:hypothetical protein
MTGEPGILEGQRETLSPVGTHEVALQKRSPRQGMKAADGTLSH